MGQDYAALAKQFGGTPVSSQPPSAPSTDYAAMAREMGGEAVRQPNFSSGVTAQAGANVDDNGNPVMDFLGELHSLNPKKINEAVQSAFWHPIDTAKGVLSAQDQVRADAMKRFESGDYVGGTAKMLYWLIPLLGPRLSQAGDYLEQGEVAKGLGATADVGVQVAAPKAFAKVGDVTANIRAKLPANPAEAAAVKFGINEGIPVDAGTATGNRFVKGVQRVADESALGSVTAEKAAQAQGEALARTGQRLTERAHPHAVDAVGAGESVKKALETRITQEHTTATNAYSRLRALEQQAPVETVKPVQGSDVTVPMQLAIDLTQTKSALQPIYERLLRESQLTPVQGAKGRALTALDRLMNGPDMADLSIVDEALGDLKSLARTSDMPELRTQGQGIAAQAVKELDAAVVARAQQAGPDVYSALMEGRTATKAKYDVADVREFVAGTDEPRAIFNRLTAGKDAGVAKLREVKRTTPDQLPVIARGLLEDILEKPTSEGGFSHAAKALADWQRIGSETRRMLFPKPGHAEALDSFFLLAKKLSENPNPSGTAVTAFKGAEVAGLVANPVLGAAYSLGAGAMSKLLHSPKAVQLMTRGMRMSVNAGPAAKTAAVAQITAALREAGVPAPNAVPAAAEATPEGATQK